MKHKHGPGHKIPNASLSGLRRVTADRRQLWPRSIPSSVQSASQTPGPRIIPASYSTHSRAHPQILKPSPDSPDHGPDPAIAPLRRRDATRVPTVRVPLAARNQPAQLHYQCALGGLWGTSTAPQHPLFIYLTPKPAPREHQGQQHTLALDRAGLNLSLASYCVTCGKLSYLSEPRSLCYEIMSCPCLAPQSGSPLVQS